MTQYKNPPFLLRKLTEITFPEGKVKGMIEADPDSPDGYIFYALLEGKAGLTPHTRLSKDKGHYDLPIKVFNSTKGWVKWSTRQ